MPSSVVYLLGYLILIAGLTYGATLMGIPVQWIVVGVIVLLGLGVLGMSKRGRSKVT